MVEKTDKTISGANNVLGIIYRKYGLVGLTVVAIAAIALGGGNFASFFSSASKAFDNSDATVEYLEELNANVEAQTKAILGLNNDVQRNYDLIVTLGNDKVSHDELMKIYQNARENELIVPNVSLEALEKIREEEMFKWKLKLIEYLQLDSSRINLPKPPSHPPNHDRFK